MVTIRPQGGRREALTLYELYDAAHAALAPARWSAASAQFWFGNPLSPWAYTPASRAISAAADVFNGVAVRRGKPSWNVPLSVEVVDERPFGNLIRFATLRQAEGDTREREASKPRVLLVAPLSGHYATLLRGTVAALAEAHDVYVTDWADARTVPLEYGRFDLDDYIAYVLSYIRTLGPDVHVIAVCQPAPAVLAAVALLAVKNDPAQPRSMVLMGGPVDVRVAPTAPTVFAERHSLRWLERTVTTGVPAYYPGAGRRVYPGFLQLGAFISMNADKHLDAHGEIFKDLVRGDGESADARRAFYDEYLSVMDVTAEYYLQTVDAIFQRALLPNGTMRWRGERVQPEAIARTALMTVEGELDDISAPGQTYAAHELCANLPDAMREHYVQAGVGHYGIFNGRRWRGEIAPRIARFIASHREGA